MSSNESAKTDMIALTEDVARACWETAQDYGFERNSFVVTAEEDLKFHIGQAYTDVKPSDVVREWNDRQSTSIAKTVEIIRARQAEFARHAEKAARDFELACRAVDYRTTGSVLAAKNAFLASIEKAYPTVDAITVYAVWSEYVTNTVADAYAMVVRDSEDNEPEAPVIVCGGCKASVASVDDKCSDCAAVAGRRVWFGDYKTGEHVAVYGTVVGVDPDNAYGSLVRTDAGSVVSVATVRLVNA
jgi:hypothetical protein